MAQAQNEGKIVINREIEGALEAFRHAIECVPHGVCMPDVAQVAVSKYYISFIHDGSEVKASRDGVEVKAGDYMLLIDDYGMFILLRRSRDGAVRPFVYGPRLALGNEVYTADEFADYIRRGLRALLDAANWL
jgi:hypothetical protein